jgi:hypothetical protein
VAFFVAFPADFFVFFFGLIESSSW